MLKQALQQLAATGSSGFEGMIQRLLGRLTGYQFYLAQSGTQLGRDFSSERVNATVLAVECKRYGNDTELKRAELLGKLVDATAAIPRLDVWVLVASRAIPDQLYSALQEVAVRFHIDVQVLSANDESPSTLEVLCAEGRDIVLEYLRAAKVQSIRAIEKELERIALDAEFSRRRDRLKAAFTTSAGYDATRQRLREWLLGQFGSEANSRAALGQAIDVDAKARAGRLVSRKQANAEFERWLKAWPTEKAPLAVLGEEGDGKTWAVASWMSAKLYGDAVFPAILWLPSREATTQDFEALIGDAVAKRLGGLPAQWLERLRRWSEGVPGNGPALILVLDGINERHDAVWWRPILESLAAAPWRDAIATILTARTAFWPSLGRLSHARCAEWIVPPFDDADLDVALRQAGIRREELPSEILNLVRRPRYFDLAVKHRRAMAESGDVTVARLIYEDWRDRHSRRTGLFEESAFQELIMALAAQHRQGVQTFDRRDLFDAVRDLEDRHAAVREIETGGIVVADGRRWRVEPARLALGFGLLLAESLREESAVRDPRESLAALMEPQPDIDLKAVILEHAALHAFETAGFSTELRVLLLAAWLTHRNQAVPSEHSVAAYFPLDPTAYLTAAESIWSDSTDDGRAELLLKMTYARWSPLGTFAQHFVRAFERWLGFVHVDGSPVGVKQEDRASRRNDLTVIIGKELASGPFEYAGTNLTAIEDDGLLRLGRLALMIISDSDRRPYVRALVAAYVADALMQYPDRLDFCRWIIRTSAHDLSDLFESDVARLIRIGTRTTLQAVYRLLGSIGTAKALTLRDGLPTDLFPTSEWYRKYEADPCSSGFSWREEHCERCAAREDVPAYFMAQQLARCARNPDFRIPQATCERIVPLLAPIDPSLIWAGVSQTEQEVRLDTIEPVLSRCAPEALGAKIRACAAELRQRHGLALRLLGHQLLSYRLALTLPELEIVQELWHEIRQRDVLEKEDERAEWSLFELMLEHLSAGEQLDHLLLRKADALVLTRFRPHFKPLPWSAVAIRLRAASDPAEASRVLFFASSHPEMVDESATTDLVEGFRSPDRYVRFLALQLIYLGDLARAGNEVVVSDWHYDSTAEDAVHEDHWGSLVLARWGHALPYEELRTRVQPSLLGRAVLDRGGSADEIGRYADDLGLMWTRIGQGEAALGDVPPIELRARSVAPTDDLELAGLARSAFAQSITFVSRHASWGGALQEATPSNPMHQLSDEHLEHVQRALGEAILQQRRAGNLWFAERFDTSALKEVITIRPDLLKMWLDGDSAADTEAITRRVWLARSFYEGLCEVLLGEQPVLGADLYRRLQGQAGAARFVARGTDIALLDHALFATADSEPVRVLWNERLDEATSDRELLVVAILAQSGSPKSWFMARLAKDLASDVPLQKARAILLRGFIDAKEPPSPGLPAAPTDVVEWHAEQQECALQNWRRDAWAQEWFDRFASEESTDRALAAFRLFLSCVDSRVSLWSAAAMARTREDRRRFVLTSGDEIERAIQENEKEFRKNFLGMEIAERQIWPWA